MRRGPRRRRVGADLAQPLMHFGRRAGGAAGGLGQQGEALAVALQHRVERLAAPPGACCATVPMRARAASLISPPSSGRSPGQREQRRFAGAVAPDQADALPRPDRQRGAVEQRAAAEADHHVAEDQEAHGPRMYSRIGWPRQVAG